MKTLLLGMGNPILTDDAVGPRLAEAIGSRLAGYPDLVVAADCSVGGLEVLTVLQGFARAIILDAVATRAPSPGRWHCFPATALRETLHLTNVHDANFATALELGHRLGLPLPEPSAIHVFAIEVADTKTFSERMTPALEARLPGLVDELDGEIRRLLGGGQRPGVPS
jgi:hydrogenase maturation protease